MHGRYNREEVQPDCGERWGGYEGDLSRWMGAEISKMIDEKITINWSPYAKLGAWFIPVLKPIIAIEDDLGRDFQNQIVLYWTDSYTVIHAIMETVRHVKSGEVEGRFKVAGLMIDWRSYCGTMVLCSSSQSHVLWLAAKEGMQRCRGLPRCLCIHLIRGTYVNDSLLIALYR
jgi:hypothetical protein